MTVTNANSNREFAKNSNVFAMDIIVSFSIAVRLAREAERINKLPAIGKNAPAS